MACLTLLLGASAAPGAAQLHSRARAHSADERTVFAAPGRDWTAHNEFSMEPYVGVFLDALVENDGREMGPLLGVRLAFEPMHRLRFGIDVGYAEVNGVGSVGTGASTFTYGNDWILTTAGAEFDVVPGNTVGMITLAGGVAWRKTEAERRVIGTDDNPELGGYASMTTVAPGVALAHMLSPRAAVRLTVQDYIIDVDEDPFHSPALSLGIVFR